MSKKGIGTNRAAKQPKSVDAHLGFKYVNICRPNNCVIIAISVRSERRRVDWRRTGNTAAKIERTIVFAASALAAFNLYISTI